MPAQSVPPEVSALPGAVDKDTELGADVQPAASDGHPGSSRLRAVQGSYGLHHGKLRTKGKSVCYSGKFTFGYSTLRMGIASVDCEALKQQHSESFCWQGFRTRREAHVLKSEIIQNLRDSLQSLNSGNK